MFSILGVLIGVWALTVVLSVLNGFGDDIRQKVIESTPNIIVDRHAGEMAHSKTLCKKIQKVKGVKECSPFLKNEVMLSNKNSNVVAILWGLGDNAGRIKSLTRQIKSGKFEYLRAPHKIPKIEEERASLLRKFRRDFEKASKGHKRTKGSPQDELKTVPRTKDRKIDEGKAPTSKPTPSTQPALPDEFQFLKPKSKKPKVLPGVLMGQELANNMGLMVGDVIRIVSPIGGTLTPMGPAPRIRKFRVAALFKTGMYEYDTKFAFVTLESAQKLFKMNNIISGFEVRANDIYETTRMKKTIRKKVGGGPYRVRDWIDLNKQLFTALFMEKLMMFVILTFIILVASFNIVSTLIMVVLEKSKEIAILKSMGATKRSIMRIFMLEGLVIGVVGTIVGLFMGWRTSYHLIQYPIKMNTDVFYMAHLPVQIKSSDFIYVAAASIILSFIATIYPALQAAKLRPVEGLQHD